MENRTSKAEEDLSFFEKIEKDFKEVVFGVLFIMLKDEQTTYLRILIFLGIDSFQMYANFFDPMTALNYNWPNTQNIISLILAFPSIATWANYLPLIFFLVLYYLCILGVILVLLDFAFVSYSFSKKKFLCMWPLTVLRNVCSLFVTVLFMPLLEYFLCMVTCVNNSEGTLANIYKTELVCWTGLHILHSALGIVIAIIYTIISIIVCVTFFETNSSNNSPDARIHARTEAYLMVLKILLLVFPAILFGTSYRWLSSITLCIVSGYIFFRMRNERPFYIESMNVYFDSLNGMYFWASISCVGTMVTENSSVNTWMIFFFFGTPIFGILMYLWPDNREYLLSLSIDQVENGETWLLKIKYLLYLISSKDTNKSANLIFTGFVNNHVERCDVNECPLDTYIKNMQENAKEKKKMKQLLKTTNAENLILIYAYIGKLFSLGLAKFPNYTLLRILHAFFLLERQGNKNLALAELINAEKYSPPFDEQFIIYRHKKTINEDIAEDKEESGGNNEMDIVAVIAYENHFKMLKESIIQSANLHMEFWATILEDHPDNRKLSKIGSSINAVITEIDQHWVRMQKLNPNQPRAIKIYSDYLMAILNDEEGGRDLILKNKEEGDKSRSELTADSGTIYFAPDGAPCIIASSEQSKFGEIIMTSLSACRVFGYTKGELVGKKIEILMPLIYAKSHSKFLNNALNSSEKAILGEDRLILGRHKSGYLVALTFQTRVFTSVTHGIQFVAIFKVDRKNVNTCYILLDKTKNIVGINSRCINYLNLSNKVFRNNQVNIGILAPSLIENKEFEECKNKTGCQISVFQADCKIEENYQLRAMDSNLTSVSFLTSISQKESNFLSNQQNRLDNEPKYKVKATNTALSFTINVFEVAFSDSVIEGYIARLEPIEDKKSQVSPKMLREAKKIIVVYCNENGFYRNIEEIIPENNRKGSILVSSNRINSLGLFNASRRNINIGINKSKELDNTSKIAEKDSENEDENENEEEKKEEKEMTPEEKLKDKKKYGEGILTRRYCGDGEFEDFNIEQDILDIRKYEGLEDSGDPEDADKGKKITHKKTRDLNEIISTKQKRKSLHEMIRNKALPNSIIKLTRFGYIFYICLIALLGTEFGLIQSKFKDIYTNLEIASSAFREIVVQMRIEYELYKYVNHMSNDKPFFEITIPESEQLNLTQNIISTYLLEYYSLQQQITYSNLSYNSEHYSLFHDNVVNLHYIGNTENVKNLVTLTDASLLMTSNIFTAQDNLNSKFYYTTEEIWFTFYNSFSELLTQMLKSADLFISEARERISFNRNMIIIIFACSFGLLIICGIILYTLVSFVTNTKFEVLALFLNIPLINVRTMFSKCENFLLAAKREGEENEGASNSDLGSEERINDQESSEFEKGKSRNRKFKNNKSMDRGFILKGVAFGILIECYFVINFTLNQLALDKVDGYNNELNVTALAHPIQMISLSMLEGLLCRDKILPMSSEETLNYLNTTQIRKMYLITESLQNIHNSNTNKVLSSEYSSSFISIMRNSLCDYSSQFKFDFDCPKFSSKIAKQGMHPIMLHYIDLLRNILNSYNYINNKYKSSDKSSVDNDTKISNIHALLNSSDYKDFEVIANKISEQAFLFLTTKLISSINSSSSTEVSRRIILFIIYLIAIILSYFIIWRRFVNNLNKDIWQTKCMLTLIPVEIIDNIKSVQLYFRNNSLFNGKN